MIKIIICQSTEESKRRCGIFLSINDRFHCVALLFPRNKANQKDIREQRVMILLLRLYSAQGIHHSATIQFPKRHK